MNSSSPANETVLNFSLISCQTPSEIQRKLWMQNLDPSPRGAPKLSTEQNCVPKKSKRTSGFVLFRRPVLSPGSERNLNGISPFIFNASFRVNGQSAALRLSIFVVLPLRDARRHVRLIHAHTSTYRLVIRQRHV
jgi:hypothetical protein